MVASSRFFVLIATISLFLAFMAVMVSTMLVTVVTIVDAVSGQGMTQNEMIGKLIKQADYALLATVLYVLALGLYSLFVDDRVPMPGWLRISDLGQLKELLAGGCRHRRAGDVPVAGRTRALAGPRGRTPGPGRRPGRGLRREGRRRRRLTRQPLVNLPEASSLRPCAS
jgi:Uncharacterized protein family, UPF0114